jgi:hypothetical protein
MEILNIFMKALESTQAQPKTFPERTTLLNELVVQVTKTCLTNSRFIMADRVHFNVVSGYLNESEARYLITANAMTVREFSFDVKSQTGVFIDVNFEFSVGQFIKQ